MSSDLAPGTTQLGPNLFRHRDTANTYLIRSGRSATCIDFGDAGVLDRLGDFGVDEVTDVVMTHHHRDVAQGLHRAAEAGARIWVPPTERELFDAIDDYWAARPLDNSYDVREDRFSLFESVAVAGPVDEYQTRRYGVVDLLAIPTPGHTLGSVSYLAELEGRVLAFTGDLLTAPGKVHSLAATQWAYNGLEGVVATIASGLDLLDRGVSMLLPAHGEPMTDPVAAINLLNQRLQGLIDLRIPERQIVDLRAQPFVEVSPHLLWNKTSFSNSYALLSKDGSALLIDFGYDFWPFISGFEFPNGTDRSSRRPWLATVPALKREYGVDRVEAVIPTHYHDDHVAGFNLLREVEGTQVWAPSNMVRIFREPRRFDLPCLWYDPIGVDVELELGRTVRWHEHELTIQELPGHTLYAVAIGFEVDGQRVLATGDQQDFGWKSGTATQFMGYNYRNRFRIDDYARGVRLYQAFDPALMISGHWPPRPVMPGYLDELLDAAEELGRLHRDLLPLDAIDFGAEGFGVRIEPYQSFVRSGEPVELEINVLNPFDRSGDAVVRLVVPTGWLAEPGERSIGLRPHGSATVRFTVRPPDGATARRARVGVDYTVDGARFGLQAEALVSVTERTDQ